MADEMLFTVAGSVAMPAQMISLEEAGLEERADLQEWVLSNPAILGPAVKVITFEFDGLPAAALTQRDRVTVLGLGADGRLVVAELKSGRTPDTDVAASKYAALASRLMPESVAEHYVRFQARRQIPLTPDEALAELQMHAPDLALETLRKPRVVLLAPDFAPALTASVVWLNEMGLDISLVQVTAFRSYVYGQLGSASVPMISVSRIYPVREVEEFTISPERQRAKEVADAKRRVQDASTVRRLVGAELVADGTIFTLSPVPDLTAEIRTQLEEWLNADPARRTAHWQNDLTAPLVWDVDKAAYAPAALVRHIVEQATGLSPDVFGTQWWRDPIGWTMVELAGPISGGRGALYREFWSRWLEVVRAQHPDWTQMTTLPAQNFITLPSPVRGTHFGLSFVAGARLRSDFYVDVGTPETSTAQFEALQAQQATIEARYGRPLSWERLPDRGAYRIADYGEGEITSTEDFAFYIDWMVDAQERLRDALGGMLYGGDPGSFGFDRR
ncbi:MAG TPA: DUF4268 domain-containing protein [Acidimicrobiales bacterium]|nr:DUF4268 domain-containing protein [Acidimicrobiales bacterium]